MDFEPGPFWDREELPLGPPIVEPGTFTRHLEELAAVLGASDDVLSPIQTTIATNDGAGLEATFTATVDRAEAETDSHDQDDRDQTAPGLIDQGENTEALRAGVLRYLPGVDAPIAADFIDFGPPQPPTPAAEEPPPRRPR